nr:MAG TPA: hypothetical protein [Caudoviricetes sp.]
MREIRAPARIRESLAILSIYFLTERRWVYNYHPRTKSTAAAILRWRSAPSLEPGAPDYWVC